MLQRKERKWIEIDLKDVKSMSLRTEPVFIKRTRSIHPVP